MEDPVMVAESGHTCEKLSFFLAVMCSAVNWCSYSCVLYNLFHWTRVYLLASEFCFENLRASECLLPRTQMSARQSRNGCATMTQIPRQM